MELNILYHDPEIIVVEKPAGLLVHPSGKPGQPNVVELLQQRFNDPEVRPVHRLDRHTSGVLVMVRSVEMARYYGKQFANGSTEKIYLAEVRGLVAADSGLIEKNLGKDHRSEVAIRRRTVMVGESAVTHFRCLGRNRENSLLELTPKTGRRHQLRVHMSDLGHPIINDPIYDLGDAYYLALRDSELITPPMHLHAFRLTVTHPRGERQIFETAQPSFATVYSSSI